ncbi:MAG: hypothetical protein IJ131_03550 [Eggerthellaceae bacterium]|nr:hypothetical protein [Eggerthellaceae bacterium]
MKGMRKRITTRGANGVVSAAIVCFFLAHGLLGSLQGFFAVPSPATWIVWAGMVLVGIHVVLCIATSFEQLTDTVRPPSVQKKRHLALKWATGIALAAVVGVHIGRIRTLGPIAALHSAEGAAWTIALAALLASHIWTGSKSLLKDLGIDRSWRNAVRAGACAFAAVFSLFALAHVLG